MEAMDASDFSGATPCKAALSSLHRACAAALLLWSFRHCHVDEGQASLEGATRDMLNARIMRETLAADNIMRQQTWL